MPAWACRRKGLPACAEGANKMTATLYVTSAETFSGKSAVCVGLGMHFRQDGLKAGYMKPVNVDCPLCDGLGSDEDVLFAKQAFEMPEPVELIGPVGLT